MRLLRLSDSGSGSLSGSVTIPASGDQYWANTVLLLKGDGNLTDSSSYGRAVTAYGNAAATGAAKYGSASLAFDGSGDYLEVPNASDFNVSGDYVLEFWIKPTSLPSVAAFLVSQRGGAGNGIDFLLYNDGSLILQVNSSNIATAAAAISANAWQHVAAVISGSNSRIYVNGTSVASGTLPTSTTAERNTRIGARYEDYYFTGLMDEIRFTKGTNRGYTGATISVPTATYATGTYVAAQTYPVTITGSGGVGSGLTWSSVPASATASGSAGQIAYDGDYLYIATASGTWKRAALTAWSADQYASSVLLLLHGDGNLTDSSTYGRTVTAGGNAAASSASAKFGTGSIAMDGASDWLTFTQTDFNFMPSLSDSWTFEAWLYPTNFSDYRAIFQHGQNSNDNYATVFIYTDINTGVLKTVIGSASGSKYIDLSSPSGLSLNTWQHIAVSYDVASETLRMFIGGSLVASSSKPSGGTWSFRTDGVRIGNYVDDGNASTRGFAGNMDEIRITKAARYTANFTPATSAFPNP